MTNATQLKMTTVVLWSTAWALALIASAIVLKNHAITPHHVATIAVFRRIEPVTDQLEDDVVARQREDEHHHSALTFRGDETIMGLLQMADEVAVEFRLRVPVVTDRVV